MNTATTNTTTLDLDAPASCARRTWFDWLFAALVVAGGRLCLRALRPRRWTSTKRASWSARCRPRSGSAGSGGRCASLMLGGRRGLAARHRLYLRTPTAWRRPGAGRAGVLAQVLPVEPERHPVDERAVLHEHGVLLDRHASPRQRRQHGGAHRLAAGLGGGDDGAGRHAWCAGSRATRSAPTSATSRSATCTKCSCCSAG